MATLSEDIKPTQVALKLDSVAGITLPTWVQCYDEKMAVTSVESDRILVSRGVGGTNPAHHSAGSTVTPIAVETPGAVEVPAVVVNTEGDPGGKIYVGAIDPDTLDGVTLEEGDVWILRNATKIWQNGVWVTGDPVYTNVLTDGDSGAIGYFGSYPWNGGALLYDGNLVTGGEFGNATPRALGLSLGTARAISRVRFVQTGANSYSDEWVLESSDAQDGTYTVRHTVSPGEHALDYQSVLDDPGTSARFWRIRTVGALKPDAGGSWIVAEIELDELVS